MLCCSLLRWNCALGLGLEGLYCGVFLCCVEFFIILKSVLFCFAFLGDKQCLGVSAHVGLG